MAIKPQLKIRYDYATTYPNKFQENYAGASSILGQKGWKSLVTGLDAPGFSACRIGSRLFIATGAGVSGEVKVKDIDTGQTITQIATNGPVYAVVTDGTYVYVGGDFTLIGGSSRNNLAKIDFFGAVQSWNPDADGIVRALAYSSSKGKIFAGGEFANVAAAAHTRFVEIDAVTGSATAGDTAFSDTVRVIQVDEERAFVYVGGSFLLQGATSRQRLARLVLSSLALNSWAPQANGTVRAIVLFNSLVYVGGDFSIVALVSRAFAASLDQDGKAGSWNPLLNGNVHALARYQDTIFMGGEFTGLGAATRNRVAAMKIDGYVDTWNPNADGTVRMLFVFERTIYTAGDIANITAQPVDFIGAVTFPYLTDTNAAYVSQTSGADTNAGTFAAPKKTLAGAQAILTAAKPFVAIKDSSTYNEIFSITTDNQGIFALDGQTPTITKYPGATEGTFGARRSGRLDFYTGAGARLYVAKWGNDALAVSGNINKPYLTAAAAITAAIAGDCITFLDDGVYFENNLAVNKSLTFEALAGKLPVICNLSQVNHTINITTNAIFDAYGMSFAGPNYQYTNDIIRVTLGSVRNIFDCSFEGGATNIQSFANTVGYTLKNNSFTKGWTSATALVAIFLPNGIATLCTIKNNYAATSAARGTSAQKGFDLRIGTTGNILVTENTVEETSFKTNRNAALPAWAIQIAQSAVGNPATIQVTHNKIKSCDGGITCLASTTSTEISFNWVEECRTGYTIIGNFLSDTCILKNNVGLNNGQDTSTTDTNESSGDFNFIVDATLTATVLENYSINSGNSAYRFFPNRITPGISTLTFKNNVAFRPTLDGLLVETYQGGISATVAMTVQGNIFYGCVRNAVQSRNIANTLDTIQATQNYFNFNTLIEPVGNSIFITPSLTLNYGNEALREVLFLSNVAGAENLGLQPDSPGILTAFIDATPQTLDVGMNNYVATIQANHFTLSGVIVQGYANLWGGVLLDHNKTDLQAAWVTFESCARYAIRALGSSAGIKAIARNSDFDSNDNGLAIFQPYQSAEMSIFRDNAGAGLYDFSGGNSVSKCSFYRGTYGIFKSVFSVGSSVTNSIGSAAGASDLAGLIEASYSDFETLDENAAVDVNSIRKNPLYADPDAGDLRLQSIAIGSFFESPSISEASDGDDMGAFSTFYGSAVTTFTEIDFSSAGFRNPDTLLRTREPIKLFEGVREDGSTYSGAVAYRTTYSFGWNPTANDMPTAQVNALRVLFAAGNGQCQIDFGSGFEAAVLLREGNLMYTEFTGLYSRDEVPTPIQEMRFRSLTA